MKYWPAILVLVLAAGCERPTRFNQMEDYGRVKPYEPVAFEPTGQSERPIPEGTVSRDQATDVASPGLAAGRVGGQLATAFPMPVTRDTLLRGQQRFEIYCSPCHGLTGDGNGMIVQRGLVPPPSFHIDRLRNIQVGHFVEVIANGWGAMFAYNDRVKPDDRWAIAAYIRVLQLSQHAPVTLLSDEERQRVTTGGGQ